MTTPLSPITTPSMPSTPSQPLPNDTTMSIHYINHSMIKEMITGSDRILTTDTSSQQQPLKPLSHSALIMLNRIPEINDLIQLWKSTMIRVVIDGAANLLVKIMINDVSISFQNFEKLKSIEKMVEENEFSTLSRDAFISFLAHSKIQFIPLFPTNIPPDVIIGDLDSAHPLILHYFKTVFETKVEKIFCQDTTDFQKGLRHLSKHQDDITAILHPLNLASINNEFEILSRGESISTPESPQEDSLHPRSHSNQTSIHSFQYHVDVCLCYNSFGGRYDQYMANIVTLHSHVDYFKRIILLGDDNIVELIKPLTLLTLDGFLRDDCAGGNGDYDDNKIKNDNLVFDKCSTQKNNEGADDEVEENVKQMDGKVASCNNQYHREETFLVNGKKVHVGVIPHLGVTKCSWLGLQWDLGDDEVNKELLITLSKQRQREKNEEKQKQQKKNEEKQKQQDQTTDPIPSSPKPLPIYTTTSNHNLYTLSQKALQDGVESDFNGLVSTNNWLTPIKTPDGHYQALFVCERPVILSLSYTPLDQIE